MALVHTSHFQPRIFPFKGTQDPTEIDRLQDMRADVTLNRTKIEEIGREGVVDWRKGSPAVTLSLTQLEYGSIEFFAQLANKAITSDKVESTEFKTSAVDIVGYKTDDDGNFLSSIWYPKFRLSGFGLNIGDPDALVERTFTLVGEDEITLKNDNKYFIYKSFTASGGSPETFSISDPTPSQDPDNSGQYLFRVVRVRGNTTTELTHGTDWSYDGAGTLTVNSTQAGDVIKVYYSASTYISGQEPFVANDSDLSGILANSASIYLVDTSNYLYALQSVSIDVTFDRFDVKEVGNEDVIARGIRDTTVTITLGRILKQWTIEEVLRGVAGLDFGKIDIRKFQDELALIIKLYEDSDKSNFKIGYKFTGLAATGLGTGVALNDYVNRSATLTGESFFITTDESQL